MNLYAYVGDDPLDRADPTGETDIIVGGQDDRLFKPAKNYEEALKRSGGREDRNIVFVRHNDIKGMDKALKAAAAGKDGVVNVACHSRGCTTAMTGIKDTGVKVNVLGSLDPVNQNGGDKFNGSRPTNITEWRDVEAVPTKPNSSDDIAALGTALAGPFNVSAANTTQQIDANHADVGQMMEAKDPSDGKSVLQRFDEQYNK